MISIVQNQDVVFKLLLVAAPLIKDNQTCYEVFGRPITRVESTLSKKVWESNFEAAKMTPVINVHLQYPVKVGFEKGDDGTFTNNTLTRVEQSFHQVTNVAKLIAKPGVVCDNPAQSIVIIDAVDEIYPSNWVSSGRADKDDVLEIWNELYLFGLKTILKVYKEMKIQATGMINFVFFTVIIFHLTYTLSLNQCLGFMERV